MADKIGLDLEIGGEASVLTIRTEIARLKDELIKMKLAGQEGTETFEQMKTRLAGLKGEVSNFNKELTNLNPHAKAQAFAEMGRIIAGGFAGATGAAALFGSSNEDLTKVLVKVQGATALLMGVQAIADARRQAGVLLNIIGIKRQAAATAELTVATEGQTAATETSTLAGKLNAVWLRSQTIATTQATIATRIWNAVLSVNPLFILLAVITAVAGAMAYFSLQQQANTEAVKKNITEREKLIESLQKKIDITREDGDIEIQHAKNIGLSAIEQDKLRIAIENTTIALRSQQVAELEKNKADLERLQKIEKAKNMASAGNEMGNAFVGAWNYFFGASEKTVKEQAQQITELTNKISKAQEDNKKSLSTIETTKADVVKQAVQARVNEYNREAAILEATYQDSYVLKRKAIAEELQLSDITVEQRKDVLNKLRLLDLQHEKDIRDHQAAVDGFRAQAENDEMARLNEVEARNFGYQEQKNDIEISLIKDKHKRELAELDSKELKEQASIIGADERAGQLHLAITAKYGKLRKDLEKKTDQEIADAKILAAESTVKSLTTIFKALNKNYKDNLSQQKAIALAEIAINEAKAISALIYSSNANPFNAATFGGAGIAQFAAGMVEIVSGIAQAYSLLSATGSDAGGGAGLGFGGSAASASGPVAPQAPVFNADTQRISLQEAERRREFGQVHKAYVIVGEVTKGQNIEEKIRKRAIH